MKTISKLNIKIRKLEAEYKGIEFEICEKNKFFERMFNVDGRTFDDIDETMYEDLKNFLTYVGKQKLNKRKLVKKSKDNSSAHIINEKPLHD